MNLKSDLTGIWRSPSTTLVGLVAALGIMLTTWSLNNDADPDNDRPWSEAITLALSAAGLGALTRSHGVSSEEARGK